MGIRTSEEWLRALRAEGAEQDAALADLRRLLLRALLGYLAQRRVQWGALSQERADELAQDCAQEALLVILNKLHTFRGESQFTTWAYQVAIRLMLGELRRRRWKEVSLEGLRVNEELPGWPIEDSKSPDPERAAQQEQIWRVLREIIGKDLTERQRSVLVAHVFQGMPLDQVAEWLGTSRDNVYKIIHDARRKLRQCLIEHGFTLEEILSTYEAKV